MSIRFSCADTRHAPQRQRGAVVIIVALALVVLIGFVGLALDLGQLFVAKSELQNAADACSLAASRELTGATPLANAEAAGMTVGARNHVMFQSEAVSLLADDNVTFSTSLTGAYLPKSAYGPNDVPNIKYVRCTVNRSGIVPWFMQALNAVPGVSIGAQSVMATAVATVAPALTTCALPLAVCQQATPFVKGQWLQSLLDSDNGLSGNFLWAGYNTLPGGGSNNGAKAIKDALTGPGICNIPSLGAQVGAPGVKNGADAAWNTRFGVYRGSYSPSNAVPDFTGYAYTPTNWPSMQNAYADFVQQRSRNASYQGDAAVGLSHIAPPSTISGKSVHADGADRRLGIVPAVNCSVYQTAQTAPVLSWNCVLMLHPISPSSGDDQHVTFGQSSEVDPDRGKARVYLEYLGQSNDPNSPCATIGLPGGQGTLGPNVPMLVQ